MNIKFIMFDLDGVLVDACEWHYESLNRALSVVGCDVITREDHLFKYNGLPTIQKGMEFEAKLHTSNHKRK